MSPVVSRSAQCVVQFAAAVALVPDVFLDSVPALALPQAVQRAAPSDCLCRERCAVPVRFLPDPDFACSNHPAGSVVLCDPDVPRAVDPKFGAFPDVVGLHQGLQVQVEQPHPLAEFQLLESPQCSLAVMALVSALVHGKPVTVSAHHPAALPSCVLPHRSDGLECSEPEIFAPDDPLHYLPRRPHDRDRSEYSRRLHLESADLQSPDLD